MTSAYYDTCIFLNCQNDSHAEFGACETMMNVERIRWSVHMCPELSAAESTAREFIENFEVECARNGISFVSVKPENSKSVTKQYKSVKRRLAEVGLNGRDWKHLMAAKTAGSEVFCTTDPDFMDPQRKRVRGAKRKEVRAQRLIERELAVQVRLPSEFLAQYADF